MAVFATPAPGAAACAPPSTWAVAAAFDLSANNIFQPAAAAPPAGSGLTVPSAILKAIGWVESGWRQFAHGRPVVSPDFGYGIMQVTSGMAGAFGNPSGDLTPAIQSRIASEYQFNIAYGKRILIQKWRSTPRIGNGDPAVLENWYYAIWAYNGWGWVNNPGNPRFARLGTPATDPATYPYQERVLYLVAHPPRDPDGNPLWTPEPVALPSAAAIGSQPGPYSPRARHRAPPPQINAAYEGEHIAPAGAGSQEAVNVQVVNTGTAPWLSSGPAAVSLAYHIVTPAGDPWGALTPFSPGVIAYGQQPTLLPQDVLPGHKADLTMQITAPSTPGRYRIVWDLEQGSGTYFSQLGVLPRARSLRVLSGQSPPPTATPIPSVPAFPRGGLKYVADTSYPDGSVVATGAVFAKSWLALNDGALNWTSGWALQQVSGHSFGRRYILLPPTKTCHTALVVALLRAPRASGSYRAAWRLRDPDGMLVGETLTVVVTVRGGVPAPTPVASSTPTSTPVASPVPPTPTPTAVG